MILVLMSLAVLFTVVMGVWYVRISLAAGDKS